ncbi:glycine cleavage system protein H [Streptomyces sp. NPDC059340]|uniref:glycine cleavage system protein H n=1 Tax=Streptomyces sp. NPDC059340 TaxID=3346806 RepID=UPI0036CD22D2
MAVRRQAARPPHGPPLQNRQLRAVLPADKLHQALALQRVHLLLARLYMPAAGQVTARNDRLNDEPELVNTDPYGDGWLIEISLKDPSSDGLLSAKEYDAHITSGD